jgi:excisionase family DNA binding protein
MSDELTFYTAAEVAAMLRLNLQVVQRKLQAGEIPAYFVGREWRIERGALLEWLDQYSNQRERPLTDRWFDRAGRLKSLPTQRAKRRAVLVRIAERFDSGRTYREAEVNQILRALHDDVALLRRELVAEGLFQRQSGIYRRASAPAPLSSRP